MLRNRGIRTKLLAVLALPIVVLMIGAAIISTQGFARAAQAAKVEKLASGASGLGDLVQRIHQERTLALTVITGQANANKTDELKRAQAATDAALKANRAFISSLDLKSLSQQAVDAVATSEEAHNKLGLVRSDIATGHAQADQVAARYDSMIAADVALPQRIGDSLTDRPIGRSLAAYSALANLVELASQEAELGAAVIAQKGVDPSTAVQLSSLQGVQNQAIQTFRLNATAEQADALDAALFQPIDERAAFTSERLDIVASLQGTPIATRQGDWIKNASARVTAVRGQLEPLAATTASRAATSAADARRQAVLLLGLGLAVVAVLVGLGLVLARAMTRPLRRLTVTAGELADELPRMVERMATPGEGPGVQLPEIVVASHDEVGQLAQAFKNVNDTTVRVAEEQAALRASIAEMFVNVARRNHVLLSRQLSFIDQLERTEENPDTLDNLFKLDHLATRMRRNAESLIVLAGIDAGRRLRRPMPLSDVIRTAVSEIERYDRVDLALQADPPLVGHVALTTAHMIAELLENATQFSNPDTRVVTATAFSNSGVRITITDLGLGMTWDEITDANQRIANPPVTDVVGSQRLGFYVVGRLARRLDATVALRPGRTQGTVVTIDLPPALFVPGSVTELPTVEVDAAPVERDAQPPALEGPATARDNAPVLPQAPVLPEAPVAPAPVAPVTQAPAETGTTGLPRRGQAAGEVRVEPRVPARPAPSAGEAPVADVPAEVSSEVASEVAADVSTDAPADAESLPKRVVARDAGPVADAPAAEAPAAPRGGIFSNFRSRRAVEETVEGTRPAAPFDLPALNTPLDDGAPEFVPVLEESSALPTRDVAPLEPLVAPEPVAEAEPVAEVAEAEPVAEVAEAEPVAEVEPEAEVESEVAVDAEVEAQAPGPLDAGWTPEPEVTPEPEPQPVLALEPETTFVPSFVPDAEPLVAPEPVAELEPVAAVEEPAEVEEPAALPVRSSSDARSALTELVRDSAADTTPAEAPVMEEPAAEVPVVPAFPVVGTPSMDILPTRGGRGRLGRRASKPLPAPAPVADRAPAPAAPPVAPTAPVPAFGSIPAARQPEPSSAPVAPAFGQEPEPAAPAASADPQPAPTSLFAPAASSPAQEAPLFSAPAYDEESVPVEPAFPSAVPAMAAAASLRERSAMASEALSELSALSSYSPQALEPGAPVTLQRRTPLATPAGQMATQAAPEEPIGARRNARNAADVRTMLSGFRAGVERGRTSPATHQQPTDPADG